MSISHYLKVIGRGTKGAGDLDRSQAHALFKQILNAEVSDLELGAFCLAMRYKGEAVSELMGFMDALEPEIHRMRSNGPYTIVLPSYNGARKQINFTALLAGLLCQQGWVVVVQGVEHDPGRVTTHSVFEALSWPILHEAADYEQYTQAGLPVFLPCKVISPKLQRLLDIRNQLGLRNSAHVLAKLLNPVEGPSWIISNYTHPDYCLKLESYFLARSVNAIIMRGSEGEPTASLQRLPEMRFKFATKEEYSSKEERFLDCPPFENIDAVFTAQITAQILAGKRSCPQSIDRQASLISELLLKS